VANGRALPRWTLAEEVAHAVSHGVGIALAIGGLATLVTLAALRGDAWHVASSAIFGTTLVLLYGASTVYHSIPAWIRFRRTKRILRILDHSAIYLAIAGTYTPFTLGPLRGPWGWALFGVVWGGAVIGIVFKSVAVERYPVFSTARRRLRAAARGVGARRDRAARRRRPLLHHRHRLLRLDQSALEPLRLAPVRARRQRPPLPRRPALRPAARLRRSSARPVRPRGRGREGRVVDEGSGKCRGKYFLLKGKDQGDGYG